MKVDVYGNIPKELWGTGKLFIAKLQRPLMGDAVMLVYDETREWDIYFPFDKEMEDLFGDELKLYAKCCIKKNYQFHIEEIVEEQSW